MNVTLRGFIVDPEGSKDDQTEEKRGMEEEPVQSTVERRL